MIGVIGQARSPQAQKLLVNAVVNRQPDEDELDVAVFHLGRQEEPIKVRGKSVEGGGRGKGRARCGCVPPWSAEATYYGRGEESDGGRREKIGLGSDSVCSMCLILNSIN
jgi:hypothetical protein